MAHPVPEDRFSSAAQKRNHGLTPTSLSRSSRKPKTHLEHHLDYGTKEKKPLSKCSLFHSWGKLKLDFYRETISSLEFYAEEEGKDSAYYLLRSKILLQMADSENQDGPETYLQKAINAISTATKISPESMYLAYRHALLLFQAVLVSEDPRYLLQTAMDEALRALSISHPTDPLLEGFSEEEPLLQFYKANVQDRVNLLSNKIQTLIRLIEEFMGDDEVRPTDENSSLSPEDDPEAEDHLSEAEEDEEDHGKWHQFVFSI